MANIHFGEIGDVWKHGPLVEILGALVPDRYLETHAGSALYPLTPSPARAYGVYHLLAEAPLAREVGDSAYLSILRAAAEAGAPQFPGSPALAMSALGDRARYLFCDLDPDSVDSISDWAGAHSLDDRVETAAADGVAAVRAAIRRLDADERRRALVFLDPYAPFEDASGAGLTPLDLLAELAGIGAPALLWYGFDGAADQQAIHENLRRALAHLDPALVWCAEAVPAYLDSPDFPFDSSYVGSGLLGVNLPRAAADACLRYGRGLERVYANARAAGDHDGSLRLEQPPLFG